MVSNVRMLTSNCFQCKNWMEIMGTCFTKCYTIAEAFRTTFTASSLYWRGIFPKSRMKMQASRIPLWNYRTRYLLDKYKCYVYVQYMKFRLVMSKPSRLQEYFYCNVSEQCNFLPVHNSMVGCQYYYSLRWRSFPHHSAHTPAALLHCPGKPDPLWGIKHTNQHWYFQLNWINEN